MTTKADFINKAYSRARISGLTVTPSPEDIELALDRLENMAAEWEEHNIRTGYNFEDNPDVNSVHNVPRKYWNAYQSHLAGKVLSDFGKQPTQTLIMEMNGTWSFLCASTACPQAVQPPSRMPVGSGNSRKYGQWNRFYGDSDRPREPVNTLYIGEINNYVEHFDSYLAFSETVASFTISADTGLTVVSSSLSSPDVSYQIKAADTGVDGDSYLRVKIVATTSTGRVETRFIQFEVKSADL